MFTTRPLQVRHRVNLQKKFPINCLKCPELYIKLLFVNTTPMEQGEGLKCQFMKNIHGGNSVECSNNTKLMFSLSQPPQGVWTQFTKYYAGNCMKCPELHRNWMVGHPHPMGRALSHITKNNVLLEIE